VDKEQLEKYLKEAEENAPPMFHPVFERNEGAWFPGNEVGSIASIISHAWEDVLCLIDIRKDRSSDYERRLLFKYIIIELRSIIEQLEKLQGIIFTFVRGNPEKSIRSGQITNQEAEEIRSLFKKYHSIKKTVENDIIKIRNGIGAHRGNQPWKDIMEQWDKLDPEAFRPLFEVIPELFERIISLDIYDWTRIPEEGVIEICCSGLKQP